MIVKDGSREVEIEVSGSHDEAMIESGVYVDDGSEVPEDVLDRLQHEYAGEIAQEVLEQMIGRAEAFYEGDR